MWILRMGLASLTRPLTVSYEWVWLIDHSVQIGRCKCLVILGIRLSVYPWGRALVYADLEPIAVVPMESATKESVNECLETAVQRTGVPRAIVDDHGADLHGGVKLFQQRHIETAEVYDVKHKAACLHRGAARTRPNLAELLHLSGEEQVRAATNGTGSVDASQSAFEGSVHEPGHPGAMGCQDIGSAGQTRWLARADFVPPIGSQIGLVARLPRRVGGMVGPTWQ